MRGSDCIQTREEIEAGELPCSEWIGWRPEWREERGYCSHSAKRERCLTRGEAAEVKNKGLIDLEAERVFRDPWAGTPLCPPG